MKLALATDPHFACLFMVCANYNLLDEIRNTTTDTTVK
jgi:hypothetical protein